MLVGTTSIENSELLSGLLSKAKLPHQVLNAKQHAREAEIVAQAGPAEDDHHRHQHGRPRHRHRAGRQRREADRSWSRPTRRWPTPTRSRARRRAARRVADAARRRWSPPAACTSSAPSATSRAASTTSCAAAPAARATRARSRFYLSLEDPLLRIFAGDRVKAIMDRLKMPEGEAIEARHGHALDRERAAQGRGAQLRHPQAAARVRRRRQRPAQGDLPAAQRAARVAATSRRTIADLRAGVLDRPGPHVRAGRERRGAVGHRRPGEDAAQPSWQLDAAAARVAGERAATSTTRTLVERVIERGRRSLPAPRSPPSARRQFAPLRARDDAAVIDTHWREHLAALDYLRQGIHLRGYAQKKPKQEYKREAFELFGAMLDSVKLEVTRILMTVRDPVAASSRRGRRRPRSAARASSNVQYSTPTSRTGEREVAGDEAPMRPSAATAERSRLVRQAPEGRPQRSLPVRLGQEVQAVPRQAELSLA